MTGTGVSFSITAILIIPGTASVKTSIGSLVSKTKFVLSLDWNSTTSCAKTNVGISKITNAIDANKIVFFMNLSYAKKNVGGGNKLFFVDNAR